MRYTAHIDSPANSRIRELLDIQRGRGSGRIWFAEGLRTVRTACTSGAGVRELFVTEAAAERHGHEIDAIARACRKVYSVSDRVAKRLSDTVTSQGIFATVSYSLKMPRELHLPDDAVLPVLDRIQDPGNLGTIIRTADAFGMQDMVLIEGTCNPSNRKAVRASAGSVFNMNIAIVSADDFTEWAASEGLRILVADPAARVSLDDIEKQGRTAVVLGNEAMGVSRELKDHAAALFSIPISGKAGSLNVAATSAIVFHEFSRHKKI